jgi:pimeloyl-ACP methyl ester carboxylesterase
MTSSAPRPTVPPLAYDDTGGDGPGIVFVHGLTFSRATWDPVVELVGDRARCVRVDLPAHGDSPGPPRRLDEVADAVRDTAAAAGLDRPVVVGHSMGALVAMLYGVRHPVAGVVNVDQTLETRQFGELVRRLAPQLRGDGFAAAFEPFRRSIGVDDLPEPLRARVAATQRIDQATVLGYWDQVMTSDPDEMDALTDRMAGELRAPYLAVLAHAMSDDERARLRRLVPQAEVEEWPGGGHVAHLAQADRFAELLLGFAARCVAGTSASAG